MVLYEESDKENINGDLKMKNCEKQLSSFVNFSIDSLVALLITECNGLTSDIWFRNRMSANKLFEEFMNLTCQQFIQELFGTLYEQICKEESLEKFGDELCIPISKLFLKHIKENFGKTCPYASLFMNRMYHNLSKKYENTDKNDLKNAIKTLLVTKFLNPILINTGNFLGVIIFFYYYYYFQKKKENKF